MIADKPALMPVQEDKTGDPSLYRLLCAYAKHQLYPCTRIDRPVSGLVVFGKNPKDQSQFQKMLENQMIQKEYLAIVPHVETKESVVLEHLLIHDTRLHKAFVSETADAKPASLTYKEVLRLDNYSVIKISTKTGRFHQIRCQMSAAGLPIKGDVKYAARRANKDKSIGLHAWKISFNHPFSGLPIQLKTAIPKHDIWTQVLID
ncbi:MAG: RNA pseudouridine synthase [Saprospiraceae bacterium]|nr:RNA pseudouridine synthase [Saprospiraceae bacterium]